jgi:hypothetical protein
MHGYSRLITDISGYSRCQAKTKGCERSRDISVSPCSQFTGFKKDRKLGAVLHGTGLRVLVHGAWRACDSRGRLHCGGGDNRCCCVIWDSVRELRALLLPNARFLRHAPGGVPISFLKARLKAASGSYPTFCDTSEIFTPGRSRRRAAS